MCVCVFLLQTMVGVWPGLFVVVWWWPWMVVVVAGATQTILTYSSLLVMDGWMRRARQAKSDDGGR